MINHARTLLLNREYPSLVCEWSEYVDPTFVPRPWPSYMQDVWRVLFGSDPDRLYLNWRAHQLMTLLHSTEFAPYVTAADPRLSYTVPLTALTDTEFPLSIASFTADPASAFPAANVQAGTRLLGVPTVDDAAGRMENSFVVTYSGVGPDAGILSVTNPQGTEITHTTIAAIPHTAVLETSGLSLVFMDELMLDYQWSLTVKGVGTPQRTLADVYTDLRRLPSASVSRLFHGIPAEPWATFSKLWDDPRSFATSMSGLLLALIYRAEELANG